MSALHPDVRRLADLGWRLHPCSQYSRAACFADASTLATTDIDQLEAWAAEYHGCGWRVVMEGSGIWALDVDACGPDHSADGIAVMQKLTATHGRLPPCPATRSGGGGYAVFFAHAGEPISGKSGVPDLGVDPRRGRQTVQLPPSIHPTTRRTYRWIVPPWEIAPPPAPSWLLDLVRPETQKVWPEPRQPVDLTGSNGRRYAIAALTRAVGDVATAASGQRNDRLNRAAWSMTRFVKAGCLHTTEIVAALAHAASLAGLQSLEIEQTLKSALSRKSR